MDLSFIAPIIKNGEVTVELCKEEIEEETQKWKLALILYVVGGSPTIGAMERYIASVWNFVAKPKAYFHNDGYFVVRFNSIEDRDEVLYLGPHMLNNMPIIVKMWSGDFDFNKEVLQTIPVWVKYPNLPLNCWGKRSLSRISSGLGIPLYADARTTQVDRISYARVLVEMDVTKELPGSIKVTDPNGREFIQEIAYDWSGTKLEAKNVKQKQEWQPKVVSKVQEPAVKEQLQLKETTNEKNASTKSKLQLAMPRQIEGGPGRQQGDTGQEDNYEYSSKGRIWLLWDTNEIECKEVSKTAQTIHTTVDIRRLDMRFTFIAVYGPHRVEDRRSMWSELTRLHSIQQGPWLIMGDYNAIRSVEDRPVGTGLTEIKTSGRNFTWTNGHTYSKIDRDLINADWMLVMPQLEVWIMDPYCSDHSPLSIALEENDDFSSKPFKFLNHLAEHDDFMKIVNEAWERPQEPHTMRSIWQKLKRVKHVMKVLNKNEYNDVGDRIKVCRQRLTAIQEQMRDPGQDEILVAKEKVMKIQLEKWLGVEESIMRQKSRVKWLKLGDANTTYFFASMKNRCSQNKIRRIIKGNGSTVQTRKDIEEEVIGFYQQLLGSLASELPTINPAIMRDGPMMNYN
ncbi:PREDICTED: uncharacterized protein LOC109238650 [Nicotiana attenuata]|uniref:uncharacterized protein LOC109238650 n=1 Tax=Nicotiana attenuata TaxID=49451 RepID=UPI000904D057|nr:PREDICTED: uncharacterized protein LOC109238650 [Nicotiana attenuata]